MRKDLLLLALLLPWLTIACVSSELEAEAHDADFFNNNGQHFYDGGHYDRARAQFEKTLELDPENYTALLGRAWSLLLLGEGQLTLRQADGARNIQLAQEAFDAAEPQTPAQFTFKVNLGRGKVHARLADLYDNRVNLLTEQMSMRPADGPEGPALAKARALRDEHRLKGAAFFHSVLETRGNPSAQECLTALIELARLAVIDQQYEQALQFTDRYLDQVRRSKEHWVENMRRFPADRPLSEARLAGCVAKEVEARDTKANILYKMGRLEEACEELQSVLLLSPQRGDAYLNRAIILEELGRKSNAVENIHEFLKRAAQIEMDPGDPRAIEAMKRLMRLEKELGLPPTVPGVPKDEGEGV